jgi:hypothetical protein
MTSTVLLLIAAAGANGLGTGASLDQSIKQLPARHRIGAVAYSHYARAADLGNGVPFYATLGLGTAALTLAAAVVGLLGHPTLPSSVALSVAIGGQVVAMLTTARAAPLYHHQRALGEDELELAQLLDRFERWQRLRVISQMAALVAVLAALALAYP